MRFVNLDLSVFYNMSRICTENLSSEFHQFDKRKVCHNFYALILLIYFQQDATLHSLSISEKLLYMFRVVSPPIIRSKHNCIYSIWYLSNRYCYLPL